MTDFEYSYIQGLHSIIMHMSEVRDGIFTIPSLTLTIDNTSTFPVLVFHSANYSEMLAHIHGNFECVYKNRYQFHIAGDDRSEWSIIDGKLHGIAHLPASADYFKRVPLLIAEYGAKQYLLADKHRVSPGQLVVAMCAPVLYLDDFTDIDEYVSLVRTMPNVERIPVNPYFSRANYVPRAEVKDGRVSLIDYPDSLYGGD